MKLYDIVQSLLQETKSIQLTHLPSQGVFYKNDFKIKIKKASSIDIIEYEKKFTKSNILSNINCIKTILRKNVIVSKGYSYLDIKSIDIIYLFIEIVKFTLDKEVFIEYDDNGLVDYIAFTNGNFSYYDYGKHLSEYDSLKCEFNCDGYKYSLPTIGVETSLTEFLLNKSDNIDKYNDLSYDFVYFLGHKSILYNDEIENLIQIFNYDIDDYEKSVVSGIVEKFSGVVGYTLKSLTKEIDIKTKLDLENIWKT